MKDRTDTALDRDRAFAVDSLSELLTQGRSILTEAIEISRKMEASIQAIRDVYDGIDKEYKVAALGSDLDGLKGKLQKDVYRETIDRMERILNKLMDDVPSYDTALAKDVDGMEEALDAVKGRISDLRGLLETGDVDLDYTAFSRRLQDVKAGWDETTEDLAEFLAEIENDMQGVSVAAVTYSHDPVNLSTGNFVYDHEDMSIGGEIPLSFHRYYNSKSRGKGSLGRCFVHDHGTCLEENAEKGKVTVTMGDGQKKTFRRMEDGTYKSLHSAMETLTKEGDHHALTEPTGERILFDGAGRMTRKENRNGRGVTFSHDGAGRLEKAETDNGTSLTYGYDDAGQLTRVTDHTGRSVELSYEKGKLAAVKDPMGNVYAYRYGKNGRIEEAVNPRGYVAVKNTYDEKRRITRQEFPDGGHMEYAYDDSRRQVILTERNGSRTTYVHDSRYRNTDILYEDGTKEHFEYNGKNQKVLHVDRNGNTTRMAYDNRGNLTQVINALGEKATLTYNADNRLVVLKVNGKEKLRNTYDGKGNLTFSAAADGTGNRITYDEQGRPVRIESPDKSVTSVTYDEKGNIEGIRDAGGSNVTYQYDSLNRVVRTVDGNGNATAYEYDDADKVSRVTNPLGAHRCYTYNESGKVTKVVDYDGYAVEAVYNAIGRIGRIKDKEGNVTELSYDSMWNTSRILQPDGSVIEHEYDKDGRLCEERLPDGGTVRYAHDANGNRTGVTDPEGNHTTYAYDALNRLIRETDAMGAETRYAYDAEGNLTCVTDAMGNQTTYAYDGMKRCVSETDAMGNTTAYARDAMGNVVSIRYANGSEERRSYESGRLVQIRRADGSSMRYAYDGNGNCTSMENGAGERLTITYDALDRRKTVTNPDGGILCYEYDAVGNITAMIDERGNRTRYSYTPNGNLASVTDAFGNETRYAYDAMGRLIRAERFGATADGMETEVQATTYRWNERGFVTDVTDPLGAVETYSYDKNGRMTDKWDRDGFHTAYSHDRRGLLTGILYGDGDSVAYSYDALRRLKQARDDRGITSIVTDALGRVTSVTDPAGKTMAYEWGSGNERLRLTYPDGREAAYGYNEKGQLTSLATPNGTITYTYDPMGRLQEKAFPNGATTTYAYTVTGMLEGIRHTGRDFEEEYDYRYDVAGNKVQACKRRQGNEADSGTFGYAYDALNRLVEVSRNGQPLRKYAYDAFGNRTVKEDYSGREPVRTTYRYNASNQLVSLMDGEGEQTYAYDRRGNLATVSRGGRLLRAYTFDAANRMTGALQVSDGLERRVGYTYDAFGNRTGQEVYGRRPGNDTPGANRGEPWDPEQQVRYTIDLTRQYHNLLETVDGSGKEGQVFYWDGNVVAMEGAGRNSYYLQDDLGSPMLLLGEDGGIREGYGFDEFGQDLGSASGGKLQPFGYTGYQEEAVGGLYFAQARRYDAGAGRFVSEDRVAGFMALPHTMNRYSYCWNQPMEHVDLNGRFPWLAIFLVVTAVVVDTGAVHSINMMEEHYKRNQNQEEYFAQFDSDREIIKAIETGKDEDGIENGWVAAPSGQNAYHRFTSGIQGVEALYNVKYLKEFPDGTSYEIVICQPPGENNDYIVKDPINMGTYNYCNPNGVGGYIGHFWKDVVPYWYLSNTLDDNLKWNDRLNGNSMLFQPEPDYYNVCDHD